ncbi:MAG: hypothetical protein V1767_06305 [Chloroflexota bacterium]
MQYIKNGTRLRLLLLILALVIAAFVRFWAAPLSAGPDVAQFWAFAKVFQQHGLDFYRYANARTPIFPFQGWGYVYPPVWLLILRLSLFAAPASFASSSVIDTSWRLAMKTPIIFADLAIGCLLYWTVSGSKLRKLIFASLWLLNPVAWYESAVFGQFDAIATAFLLGSIIALEQGKDRLAFLLAALAVLTKQHTLLAVVMMIVSVARSMDRRRFIINCAIGVGIVLLFSIPFLLTGNFLSYARSVLLPGQSPNYQTPLMYAFSGVGALLTYLHNVFGWETRNLLQLCVPVLVAVLLAAIILSYIKQIAPIRSMLIGILLFMAIFYRINYQYLVVYIPLALLIASRTSYKSEKVIALLLALFPAAWLWLFYLPGWFIEFNPAHPWVASTFAPLGLAHYDIPDLVYVSFALVIMCLALTYVFLAFLKWHRELSHTQNSTS